ncbi:NAD(P)H-dependent oxidoreductase [Nocardiopsis ansamitocini]|uniref:FMN reductase n=1 Tax=Nocardiopsis ansamitocini TaxID=1670832 RepID=A0A9W6P1X5_9ACTN|nr:NAD(P)H-dependent oxidoreductase [Nocardiopsis ansamitocini]GLU45705.1 FMN reductase [Nocardiopsis ansamitocini]
MSVTVLVGNPRPGSRTASAALAAADRVAAALGLPGGHDLVELAVLGPDLLVPGPPPEVADALHRVGTADVLIVASPTYKATYTGLLKVFLDLLPSGALTGTTALPLLVMGSPAHTLAVEVHLRPLLVELGAEVPTPGLAVLQGSIAAGDGSELDAVLAPWVQRVAPQIRQRLRGATA